MEIAQIQIVRIICKCEAILKGASVVQNECGRGKRCLIRKKALQIFLATDLLHRFCDPAYGDLKGGVERGFVFKTPAPLGVQTC